jgi:hypothetical protein
VRLEISVAASDSAASSPPDDASLFDERWGGAHARPASTVRSASVNIAPEADFGTNPAAPWASVRETMWGASWPEMTMIGSAGWLMRV